MDRLLGLQETDSRIFRQSVHESGKIAGPTHRPSLPPGGIPSTHFCKGLSRLQGHIAFGRIKSMKNPNDSTRNRNGDLTACSAAPPPNAPPNVLSAKILYFIDRASRYKFLLITNLTHFFTYLFISSLYTFRASQCSSSGDRIVLIHHLV